MSLFGESATISNQRASSIDGLADAYHAIAAGFAKGLEPPPPLDFSEWGRENVVFGNDSEFAGKYNPELFPFFKEVLECLQPDHPAREVVLKKSAQIGGTIVAQIFAGACLHLDPGPFVYIHPSLENGARWVRTKWSPFVRMCIPLRGLFDSDRSRSNTNTTLHKERKDRLGYLMVSGANSASSLSMFSTPRQVQDDLAKWEANEAGDSETQADSRSEAFPYAKIFKVSTPMVKGVCRIDRNYELSDQRVFEVPCPQCGHMQDLTWENFKQSLHEDMDPADAHFTCEHGCVIEHHHKQEMVSKGRWRALNPKSKVPGFYIWSAYSPLTTWARIAEKYLKAKDNPEAERAFYNDSAGLAYEQKGEAPPWKDIRARAAAAGMPRMQIPPGYPLLVCGVDVQGDRVECHIKAFGPDLKRFTVDYRIFEGHITEERVRAELDALLKMGFTNAWGRRIKIDMLAIDANYHKEDVLDWAKKHPDSRVIAVRGVAGEHRPPLMAVQFEKKRGVKKKRKQKRFFNIGVSPLKVALFKHLEKDDPAQRGFCGYPSEMADDFFQQLCSERRVLKVDKKSGYAVLEWQKLPGVRNEVLDTEIYAEAAARRLGWTELSDAQWDRLAAERECPPTERQLDLLEANLAKLPEPAPPKKPPPPENTGGSPPLQKEPARHVASQLA